MPGGATGYLDVLRAARPPLIERVAKAICCPRLKWSTTESRAVPGPCDEICSECLEGAQAAARVMLEEYDAYYDRQVARDRRFFKKHGYAHPAHSLFNDGVRETERLVRPTLEGTYEGTGLKDGPVIDWKPNEREVGEGAK